MSVKIDPNVMYTRENMISLVGKPVFNAAVKAGLRAVGDQYLGAKVLEYVALAHDILIQHHADKRREKDNEEASMEKNPQRKSVHPVSGGGGAADFHRKMAAAQGA
jgi:hypothetical protein